VADLGFTQPTTVQDKVIPLAMGGSRPGRQGPFIDLMVSSQTGSGKTAAFLLPVLHTLLKRQAEAEAALKAEFQRLAAEAAARGEAPPKKAQAQGPDQPRNFKAATPGALILCPTRELAQQVAHDAIDLVKHCRGLRIANVVGGMPYQLQIAKLQNANLVVATPGPPARPAALAADQARPGALPGGRRGRPHAGPRLRRRPGRSQPAHHRAPADDDVQRHLRAAHPAAGPA
jgi:superfamily II DNA/RNA helicase